MKITWKMSDKETGLRAVGAGPRRHCLRIDGEDVATVYPNGGHWARKQNGWYWVAFEGVPHRNTNSEPPYAELADAKAACKAYVLEHWAKKSPPRPLIGP